VRRRAAKVPTRTYATLVENARTLTGWMAWTGFATLALYACGLLADVAMRGGLDDPNDGIRDLGELLVPAAITAFFPLAFLEQGNVALSFLGGRMGARAKAIMGVVMALAVAALVAFFAARFGKYAAAASRTSDTLQMFNIPKSPFWRIVEVNLWLTVGTQAIVLAGQALALRQAIKEARARPRWLR